jgi:hypothetical protein
MRELRRIEARIERARRSEMCLQEPTLDELLSDPIMELVLHHSRITKRQIRELIAEVAVRIGQPAARPVPTAE